MLRVWNLSLVAATFCLTILGTFLTRSGIVNSVHCFTQSAVGPLLLLFLGVVATTSVALIWWRADRLRAPGRIDSPLSREAAFLGNNLAFAAFALVVLIGTTFPLVAEAYDGRQLSVGEPYFDQMTMPIGFALLFLMAAAPALPWRAASSAVLHRRLATPAWTAAVTMAAAALVGLRGLTPLLALGLGTFAVAGVVRQFAVGARAHWRVAGSWGRAVAAATAANRRLYGGLVVHVGVVIFALAFTMSSAFATGREVRLEPGSSTAVRNYQLTYLGSGTRSSAQKTSLVARVRVERDGRTLGVYEPRRRRDAGRHRRRRLAPAPPATAGRRDSAARRDPDPPPGGDRTGRGRCTTVTMARWRRLSWAGVVLVVVGALVVGTRPSGVGSSPDARAGRLAAELRCPVCQGLSVLDSDSSTARSIRADVGRRIEGGATDAEIRQAYVDRYGERILLRPRGEGLGALVWVLPVAGAAAGVAGVSVALWRWRRRLGAQATAEDRAIVERALAQALGHEP